MPADAASSGFRFRKGYGVAPIEGALLPGPAFGRIHIFRALTVSRSKVSADRSLHRGRIEGAGGAVYDFRAELRLRDVPKVMEARELEIDIDTVGPQTVTLYKRSASRAASSGLPPTWSCSPGLTVLIATATLLDAGAANGSHSDDVSNANLEQFMAGRHVPGLNIAGLNCL